MTKHEASVIGRRVSGMLSPRRVASILGFEMAVAVITREIKEKHLGEDPRWTNEAEQMLVSKMWEKSE
jgi:hypothetical protein